MKRAAVHYQVEVIRRHIARSLEESRRHPVPVRRVAAGQVKQYVIERMFNVLHRNGGFV